MMGTNGTTITFLFLCTIVHTLSTEKIAYIQQYIVQHSLPFPRVCEIRAPSTVGSQMAISQAISLLTLMALSLTMSRITPDLSQSDWV